MQPRTNTVALTPAIQRAQDELRTTREQLDEARQALLEAVRTGHDVSLRDAVQAVQERTGLDPGMIQHALWALIHERTLELDDELNIVRPKND